MSRDCPTTMNGTICSTHGLCDPRSFPPSCRCDRGWGGLACQEELPEVTNEDPAVGNDGGNGGAVAGAVIGVLIGIVLLVVLIVFAVKKVREMDFGSSSGPSEGTQLGSIGSVGGDPYDDDDEPVYKPPKGLAPGGGGGGLRYPWEENFTDDGEVFYYNTETGESVWEKP